MSMHSARSGHSHRPPIRRQKCKDRPDRAYCTINGKRAMLGVYGSPEALKRYDELTGNKNSQPKPAPSTEPTVSMLMVDYLAYLEEYYPLRPGRRTTEYHDHIPVLRHLKKVAGSMMAREFGPRKLKEVRQSFIDAGQSRGTVNKNVRRVRRMFRWAASEERIDGSVWHSLKSVEGLQPGRTTARETDPVRPVSDADVEATIEYLPQVVGDMVSLQRFTGMRPGELCQLRVCDIDRTGEVWLYRPQQHKTQHRGKSRVVAIGPKAQSVLLKYLARGADDYCFRPCDSEEKRRAQRHAERKTPINHGNRPGGKLVDNPRWQPGEAYTVDSYRRAIHRACDKAFPAPAGTEGDELKQWQHDHRWSPNQLRHAAATMIRREFGLEAAQVILGHSEIGTTQIYAERDLARGIEVAKKIG